jgi:glycosyltransferase involved in cell wall biosynthesis
VIDVVLPCLNEAAALPWVLARIPDGFGPIAADNGSTVVHASPRGFGAAAHAGLCAASPEVVCFLDADGSLDPSQLRRVATEVAAGRADLVLGRRRPTQRGAWPVHARLGNAAVAWRLRSLGGAPVRDLGPMRAVRWQALLDLDLSDRRLGYPWR